MNTGRTPGIVIEETRSFVASGAVTKWAAVVLDANNTGYARLPSAANDSPLGVAEYGVADAKTFSVVVKGTVYCVAAGAIARNAYVVINGTTGSVKTDPATGSSTSKILGKALTPASTAGDLLVVEIHIFERYNHA